MKIRYYQGITTKYLGPTNTKGARIKVTSACGHLITRPWDHSLNIGDNHAKAAQALASKLGWSGNWRMGSIPGPGYAFVCDGDAFTIAKEAAA